jgi:anthranilate synthase/aminodeoxychorismate synthase-like glutamine amidotransferase
MRLRLLVIDNYDSFTYCLADSIARTGAEVLVIRNDAPQLNRSIIKKENYHGLVISPGPGSPSEILHIGELILGADCPVLGVCLGHQLMAELMGGKIICARRPFHGKTTVITHHQRGIFANIPASIRVMRYHSLIVAADNLPPVMSISAQTETGEIMALDFSHRPWQTVQFHPESILTEYGNEMIANWVAQVGKFSFVNSPSL